MSEVGPKKRIISVPEVLEMLKTLDPEKSDQLQKRTLDYALRFSKLPSDKVAKSLTSRLVKECNLTNEEAAEVVNCLPGSIEELRVFATGWRKLLTTETLEKILKLLREASQ